MIMTSLDLLLTRRSIRRYENKALADDQVHACIKAAMAAPSAGNEQPWHFLVLQNKKVFEALMNIHPSAKMLHNAAVAILVCGDLNLEKYKGYWMIDCAAATQNLLLAAHFQGIGACWLGIYPRDERMQLLSEQLHLPEQVIPFALVSLGYPAEKKAASNRYSSDRIHYDSW